MPGMGRGDTVERTLGRAWSAIERGDARPAVKLLGEALAQRGLDAGDEADLRHALGAALDDLGDEAGRDREWLAVLRLDTELEDPEPLMPPDQFERLASAALEELPAEILERLGAVAILVDDRPTEGMVRDGIDPRLLGLYTGVPYPDQSSMGGGGYPEVIHLFQRNLDAECVDEDDLPAELRITVIHETAHYFGMSDEELHRLGLG
jgi:predicted Zn-dependent protease with MMP-like domain